jgi:hypothetical protein
VIRHVAATSSVVAVVHSKVANKSWRRGEVVQFDVTLTRFSHAGQFLSEESLSGLPVGEYEGSILVMDYGPLGRRYSYDVLTLVRVPVSK